MSFEQEDSGNEKNIEKFTNLPYTKIKRAEVQKSFLEDHYRKYSLPYGFSDRAPEFSTDKVGLEFTAYYIFVP